MPNFNYHLGASALASAVLVAYGEAAYGLGQPASGLAFLAGVAGGVLPDLDSDSSIPLRFSGIVAGLGAASAVAGFAMADSGVFDRPWRPLTVAVAALAAFVLFNALTLKVIKKITVHRGLFHSFPIPFLYAGVFALLISSQGRKTVMAVWILGVVGVFTHLVMDAVRDLSFNPLKFATSDISASTRLWFGTALVNLLALIYPFIPLS
ncbi:MAG: metal-dependent hydrolase [Deltaproteobacteria bacterium]|nr:metal-dependent hydrolase [Deltaproteobacteria bacterium]